MLLSIEDQNQLDLIFQNSQVTDIILSIQLYFLSDNPDENYATKLAVKEIKNIIKRQFRSTSENITNNLEIIIGQVVSCLMNQQDLFLNQLKIEVFKEYYSSLKQKKQKNLIDIFNIFYLRLQKIYKEYHYRDAKKPARMDQIFANKIKTVADFFILQANSPEIQNRYLKYLGLGFMAFCVYLAVADLYQNPSINFQIRNVVMFLLAFAYYSYYANNQYILGYIDLFIESLKENKTPTLGLHKIEFCDLQSKDKETKNVYLPIDPEQAITHLEEIKPNELFIKTRPQKDNRKYIAQVPQLLNSANIIFWPNKTLLRDPKEEWIGSDSKDVVNVQGGHYPNNRFYAFFNLRALEKQINTDPDSVPFKDYWARWEERRIVSQTSHSGNKKLTATHGATISAPILEKGKKQFIFFQWELKTLNTLARLLGSECMTVMSKNGERHTLIDYCYHVPEGLGH